MIDDEYALPVFIGGGERYHESASCPRGDSKPSFWGFAVDAGLEPCGKCASSFEAS
jgi:hypothetical protein